MRNTKKKFLITVSILSFLAMLMNPACLEAKNKAEKLGFKLAVQSYTFHKFSLEEALDKTVELGVKYIEVFPGHSLGGKWGDKVFDFNLTSEERQQILQLAKKKGVKIVGSGVFVSENREEWQKMFQFAKEMRMEFITCEPPIEMWNYVEELSREYGIKVSVHNHPQPSAYWNPQNLLDAISTRSESLGSCADVGHWKREGLDNLDCLKKLKGRIISSHFKDIVAKEEGKSEQHDTVWGTGILDVKGMLKLLHQQKFKGYLSIEYEYHWENSVPEIKKSIDYFNKVIKEL